MRKTTAADILFSKTRQGVLGATFVSPERWWYLSELARHLGVTPSTLQREMVALVRGGLLRSKREGRQLYFKPETESPLYPDLRGIVLKTVGVVDVLRRHLHPLTEKIAVALVYGSVARAEETVLSDIDLLIVGDVTLGELSPVLRKAERVLDRPIHVNVYSARALSTKLKSKNHFLLDVIKSPKLFIVGTENDLVEARRKEPPQAA